MLTWEQVQQWQAKIAASKARVEEAEKELESLLKKRDEVAGELTKWQSEFNAIANQVSWKLRAIEELKAEAEHQTKRMAAEAARP